MGSALTSHPADCPESPDATATEPSAADAATVGPGATVDSVLSWVTDRAASAQWSLLRPAEELAAYVHPADPVLREHVLRQARCQLGSTASRPPDRRDLRALATLSVAINLSVEQGRDLLDVAPDDAQLARPGPVGEAPAGGQRPVGGEPYPKHPDYFIG